MIKTNYTFQHYKLMKPNQYQEQGNMDPQMRIFFGFCIHIFLNFNKHSKWKFTVLLILPPFLLTRMNVISNLGRLALIQLYWYWMNLGCVIKMKKESLVKGRSTSIKADCHSKYHLRVWNNLNSLKLVSNILLLVWEWLWQGIALDS